MASYEEEKRCPLCAEEIDWTDQQFMPCKCGYQVCVWCWHHIIDMAEKDETEARCPACRTVYEKEKIVAMQTNCERPISKSSNRKARPPKAKPKAIDVKKDLTNVRVIQRKMAYVIGLPLSLADEDLLQQNKCFGQYGKITKVCLSRTAGGAIQKFVNDTCSVYITYSKEEEALQCIQLVHGFVLEDNVLRASFGTAKYCHAWLKNMPCNNSACLYLHSIGADEDSFGKDDVAAVQTRSRVQEIVGAANTEVKRTGSVLPPPVDLYNCIATYPDKSTIGSPLSDGTHRSIDTTCSLPYTERGVIDGPYKMTTFVYNVGQDKYNSSGPRTDGTVPQDWRVSNLSSELYSLTIDGDICKVEPYAVPALFKVSSTNRIGYTVEDSLNNFSVKRNPMNYEGVASLPTKSVDTVLNNDSCMEVMFQNSAKSDRIYRSCNSFSNEEIVEHLRRIDDDDNNMTNGEEYPALNVVENSIISNIMSIDFDSCEDSMTMPSGSSKLLDEPDRSNGSSWNSFSSDQSGYSFVKQDDFAASQIAAGSVLLDFGDKKDQYLCKAQYPVTRSQSFAPRPVPSRDPPPGFSSSGRRLVNSSLLCNNMLQQFPIEFNGSIGDIDFNTFDDNARLWFLIQQSASTYQDSKFSQMSSPQMSSVQQDPSHMAPRISGLNGLSPNLVNQHQNCDRSSIPQQKYSNGHIWNDNEHLHCVDSFLHKSGQVEKNNKRLGLDNYFPGYGSGSSV